MIAVSLFIARLHNAFMALSTPGRAASLFWGGSLLFCLRAVDSGLNVVCNAVIATTPVTDMTHDELKTLKAADGRNWEWLTVDVPDVGLIEVGGEFEPAHYEDRTFYPSDFSVMAAVVDADTHVVDLTLLLSDWATGAINEQACNTLDRIYRAAHYEAQADAARAAA